MDEPCSALDPISTLAIEDLMSELKQDYTIVIVTHNMQQAARVSDRTAFFSIDATGEPGRLIEIDETAEDLHEPGREADRGLHHRPLRLTPPRPRAASGRSELTAQVLTTLAESGTAGYVRVVAPSRPATRAVEAVLHVAAGSCPRELALEPEPDQVERRRCSSRLVAPPPSSRAPCGGARRVGGRGHGGVPGRGRTTAEDAPAASADQHRSPGVHLDALGVTPPPSRLTGMQVLGHRGWPVPTAHPENTVAAMLAALDAGADGVEVDVQLTRDGIAVCFHDDTLDRRHRRHGAGERADLGAAAGRPAARRAPHPGAGRGGRGDSGPRAGLSSTSSPSGGRRRSCGP